MNACRIELNTLALGLGVILYYGRIERLLLSYELGICFASQGEDIDNGVEAYTKNPIHKIKYEFINQRYEYLIVLLDMSS